MLYVLGYTVSTLLGYHQANIRTLKVSYKIWLFMPDGILCGLQYCVLLYITVNYTTFRLG
jgi:hypothetical protein